MTAYEQTAGRGRQGRRWSAPPGSSVLMSLVLRWTNPTRQPSLLPLIAAVAVCDIAGAKARVKWPNDIVLERDDGTLSKLAGILAEGRPQQGWAVLGVGLNVAVRTEQLPLELQSTAASLNKPPNAVEPTLHQLLAALSRRLAQPTQITLDTWRSRDALRGRQITWAQEQGRAEGIDGLGRLVVMQADGRRSTLDAGEVHLAFV